MIRVMIIEDDYIVRLYLKNNIDWKANGIEVVAEASNGETCLEILETTAADIVVTDMSMPGMDGITLIKNIKEAYPNIKIIVLSCHNDFALVKDAMKFGAVEYILKHTMEPANLIETIKNVAGNDKGKEIEKLKKLKSSNDSNSVHDYAVVEDLLRGNLKINEENAGGQLAKMNIKIGLHNICVINIDVADRGVFSSISTVEENDLYKYSVFQVIENVMEGIPYTSVHMDNRFVILLSLEKYNSSFQIDNILKNTVSFISASLFKELNIKTFIAVSNLMKDISQLSAGYGQSLEVFKYRIYKSNASHMFYSEISKGYQLNEVNDMINDFKDKLKNGNYIEGERLLLEIYDLIEKLVVSPEDLGILMIELLNIASGVAEDIGLNQREVFGTNVVPYNNIKKFSNIKGIFNWYTEIYQIIKKCVVRQNAGGYRKEIRNAIEYIAKNIESEITLNTVANHVNVSAVYFSQLFKQQTGVNFSEYLSKMRIERAKKLLEESDMKVYEVAYKSGFSQPQYFIKIFKDMVGMTPLDYKKYSAL